MLMTDSRITALVCQSPATPFTNACARIETLQSRLPENGWHGISVLLAMTLGTAWMAGGSYLLSRHLWMDEIHSWILVSDPDTGHAIRALADGVDFNPPTWFLAMRMLSFPSSVTEFKLRVVSLLWMLLALAGLYRLLLLRFSGATSRIAVLLTAAHPLLIHHSTEIRFYGFWCASVLWLCNCLLWEPESAWQRRLQRILNALLTLSVVTCHYFGILSLGLVTLPLLLRWKANRRVARPARFAIGIGCVGLLTCLPFLTGQRAALTRPTWISPPTITDSLLFLQTLFPVWQIGLCLAGYLISRAVISRTTEPEASKRGSRGYAVDLSVEWPGPKKTATRATASDFDRCLWPCLSLSLMPAVIVVVSWCVQPALVTRYAIVGLAGFAPLFAILLDCCVPVLRRTILICALLGYGHSVASCVADCKSNDRENEQLIAELSSCPSDEVIVFEDRIVWMAALHCCPELAGRCVLADFTETQLSLDSSLRIVQRDVARRIAQWYPRYSIRSLASLNRLHAFCVVPYHGGTAYNLKYPSNFLPERTSRAVYRFVRNEPNVVPSPPSTLNVFH